MTIFRFKAWLPLILGIIAGIIIYYADYTSVISNGILFFILFAVMMLISGLVDYKFPG